MNSPAQWITIGIEALAIIALAIGFMHEPQIARWEQRQGRKIKRKLLKAWNKANRTTLPPVENVGKAYTPGRRQK